MARFAVRSRVCRTRGTLQKARVWEVGAKMMTGRKFLSPPLLALAPQSDHGSAACAETVAFFQYGPPQSFFELTWLAPQKARVREVAQQLMTRRKFLSPALLWLAPQSDHPPQSFAEPARAREVGARTDDRAQSSQPPLLALAPQSDRGSAAPRGN